MQLRKNPAKSGVESINLVDSQHISQTQSVWMDGGLIKMGERARVNFRTGVCFCVSAPCGNRIRSRFSRIFWHARRLWNAWEPSGWCVWRQKCIFPYAAARPRRRRFASSTRPWRRSTPPSTCNCTGCKGSRRRPPPPPGWGWAPKASTFLRWVGDFYKYIPFWFFGCAAAAGGRHKRNDSWERVLTAVVIDSQENQGAEKEITASFQWVHIARVCFDVSTYFSSFLFLWFLRRENRLGWDFTENRVCLGKEEQQKHPTLVPNIVNQSVNFIPNFDDQVFHHNIRGTTSCWIFFHK